MKVSNGMDRKITKRKFENLYFEVHNKNKPCRSTSKIREIRAPLEDAFSENWNVENEANIYIIRQ